MSKKSASSEVEKTEAPAKDNRVDWENTRLGRAPKIGDIVLYMRFGSPGKEHLPEPSPAIVVHVNKVPDGNCQLFVMNPNGLYFNNTPFSPELKPGHWSAR